jgi:hypothetical protein
MYLQIQIRLEMLTKYLRLAGFRTAMKPWEVIGESLGKIARRSYFICSLTVCESA